MSRVEAGAAGIGAFSGSERSHERRPSGRARVPIAHGAVDLRRADRPVAEVLANEKRTRTRTSEERPGRVLGDVRMPLGRRQAGHLGQAPPEPGEGRAVHLAAVRGDEKNAAPVLPPFTQPPAEHAHLIEQWLARVALESLHRGEAPLQSLDPDPALFHVDVLDPQARYLRHPQPVPDREQDHGMRARAVPLGRLEDPEDLLLLQRNKSHRISPPSQFTTPFRKNPYNPL